MGFETVLLMVFAFAAGIVYIRFKDKMRTPFKWECPEPNCGFSISTNKLDATTKVQENHTHTFHERI
jgi:hypothetical protein